MLIEPLGRTPSLRPFCTALGHRSHPALLDSSQIHERYGRYSYFAWEPYQRLWASDGKTVVEDHLGKRRTTGDSPLARLESLLEGAQRPNATPFPFAGGAIGYFSYDFGAALQSISLPIHANTRVPDLHWAFYDRVIVHDHLAAEAFLVDWQSERGRRQVAELRDLLTLERPPSVPLSPVPGHEIVSNFSREAYFQAIGQIREYIRQGEVYQVNFAQECRCRCEESAWRLYERLAARSPSPYAAFLEVEGQQILSSSPELFLRKRGKSLETRPIKGTRPRGRSEEDDEAQLRALRESAKDRAELLMIVDLERNDFGRICEAGSVRVDELFSIERYPHVFHQVARVTGQCAQGVGLGDIIRATFPGGSITGAPKLRAMEIISELEGTRRGVYTGSLGWIGFDGDMELNIAIRTLIRNGDQASFHVGGGIVWDSEPAAEYDETWHKARGLLAALRVPQP